MTERPLFSRIDRDRFLLSVVMPCFNELRTIEEIVRRVRAAPFRKEIIIVDDGSTDGTRDILARLDGSEDERNRVRVILQPKNRGKGAALRTGFEAAKGDVVVIQDADLEYNPSEYAVLCEPILAGKADVVYGTRFSSQPHRVLYFWHSVANGALTVLSNVFSDLNLTDMETGYKVFRREALQMIELAEDRFGFEPEVTLRLSRIRDLRFYEVPISYDGRTYEEGKKIGFKDAVRALYVIGKYGIVKRPKKR